MEKMIVDERTGLQYELVGDYYLPVLEAPEAPRIGKFGAMRHQYLRSSHRGIFDGMLLEGTLNAHLEEIDRQANEMMERLTEQMAWQTGDGSLSDPQRQGTVPCLPVPGPFRLQPAPVLRRRSRALGLGCGLRLRLRSAAAEQQRKDQEDRNAGNPIFFHLSTPQIWQ